MLNHSRKTEFPPPFKVKAVYLWRETFIIQKSIKSINNENKTNYAIDVHDIGCDCKSGILLMQ